MSYTIYKSDGTQLTQVNDGEINQTTTNLTLVGKNSSSYGVYFNENFFHLLENFASASSPTRPQTGMVWYDKSSGRLKVYDGNLFKVTGGALVSATAPAQLAAGDVWIDSTNQQMYFNDGVATLLAGPIYTKNQGQSGFKTDTILDTLNAPHTVLNFYLAGSLVGVYSLATFTPLIPITGYTNGSFTGTQSGTTLTITAVNTGQITIGQILSGTGMTSNTVVTGFKTGTGGVGTYSVSSSNTVASTTITVINKVINAGFNISSYPGLTFNVQTSTSSGILDTDGTIKTVSNFMSTGDLQLDGSYGQSITLNKVVIANDTALQLGSQQSSKITSTKEAFKIESTSPGATFQVNVVPSGAAGSTPALYINSNVGQIGVYTVTPQATLDVNGAAIVRGNLSVTGTNVSITTPLTPANAQASGTVGQIQWDANYLYVYVGTSSTFTGSISGTTLTAASNITGTIQVGMYISGTGVTAGTKITALDSGSGGLGTYTITPSQTVSSGSITAAHNWKRIALTAF